MKKQSLLTVSDQTGKVYEISLEGDIIRIMNYTGSDLEGVCFNNEEQIIAVTEERSREVVFLDYPEGNEISRYKINVEIQAENKGLEGISYNSNNNMYYILNEALPGQLLIWNPDLGLIGTEEPDFASDYSGLCVDAPASCLWILSDESALFSKCDYKANPLITFMLTKTKFEGIAVDEDQNLVYLVNDGSSMMDCYKLIY